MSSGVLERPSTNKVAGCFFIVLKKVNLLHSKELYELDKQAQEEDYEALEKYRLGTAEAPTLYRPMGFMKSVDKDTGDMTFVANEESEDRMGDIIKVDGWQLGNFKENPVLMFAHDYRMPPVGIVPRVWKSSSKSVKAAGKDTPQLLNTVKFDDGDQFATFIKGKYERGFMRAESVGFRPIEFEALDTDSDSWFPPLLFTKQELLEISLVPIPAHPRALRKAWGEDDSGNRKFLIVMPKIEIVEEEEESESTVDESVNDILNSINEKIDKLVLSSNTAPTLVPFVGSPDDDDDSESGIEMSEKDIEDLSEALKTLRED